MAGATSLGVLRDIQTLFDAGTGAGLTDRQLLERFATASGEPRELAFAALVERHGPCVLRVCRSVLRDDAPLLLGVVVLKPGMDVQMDGRLLQLVAERQHGSGLIIAELLVDARHVGSLDGVRRPRNLAASGHPSSPLRDGDLGGIDRIRLALCG